MIAAGSQGSVATMSNIPVKEPVFTLSAGPVAVYPRVLRAMARPVHYDFDAFFQGFYENVTQ
jgi:pyridoxamine--pyruvate transaminase